MFRRTPAGQAPLWQHAEARVGQMFREGRFERVPLQSALRGIRADSFEHDAEAGEGLFQ